MAENNKPELRVLIVYPNLPLMLVPSLAVGIITRVLKDKGYRVDLFETTGYLPPEESSSPENRVKFSQTRGFDYERDLGIKPLRSDMRTDFRDKVTNFNRHLILFSVVEDGLGPVRDPIGDGQRAIPTALALGEVVGVGSGLVNDLFLSRMGQIAMIPQLMAAEKIGQPPAVVHVCPANRDRIDQPDLAIGSNMRLHPEIH